MLKIRLSIWQKIFGSFLLLLIVMVINSVIALVTLSRNEDLIAKENMVLRPSFEALQKLEILLSQAQKMTTTWLYEANNEDNKLALRHLHNEEYPKLKREIDKLAKEWPNSADLELLDSVFMEFDALIAVELVIMKRLGNPQAYTDTTSRDFLSTQNERHQLIYDKLKTYLTGLAEAKEAESQSLQMEIGASFGQIRQQILLVSLVSILVSLVFAYLMGKSITEPIHYIKALITMLSEGELPKNANQIFQDDEIGEMAQSVNTFVDGMRRTSVFAQDIGSGLYDANFAPLSDRDMLGNALLGMRENLRKSQIESTERKWINEGLVLIQDVIRSHQHELNELADRIMHCIVKYFGANQGGIFILTEDEIGIPCLELEACYAWGKKKHLKKRVYKGEGLTGQCWHEGELKYLSEVPSDYIEITSGLGQALPNYVIIVPLMLNDIVMGMIELASFKQFAPYQVEFLRKLGESVASTFSILSNNAQSKRLVQESNDMMQQIAAQEEEMRQNLEELTSTQEEMARTQHGLQAKNTAFSQCFMTLELDEDKNVIDANDAFYQTLRYSASEVLGRTVYLLFEDEEDTIDMGIKHILKGEKWFNVFNVKNRAGQSQLVSFTGSALKSKRGQIERYLLILGHLEYSKQDIKTALR